VAGTLTQLNQVVTATNLAPGASVALPHNINVNGVPKIPDFVFPDNSNFSVVSCTSSTLTVKNGGTANQTGNFWLWEQFSTDRAYGGKQITFLTPHPFVPAGGTGGGGGATTEAFRYIATGAEGSDFNVVLPSARAVDTYKVFGSCAGVALIFAMDYPDLLPGDRTTTQFRVVTTGSLTAGDQIDFFVTD
jgi:hypothetical protein